LQKDGKELVLENWSMRGRSISQEGHEEKRMLKTKIIGEILISRAGERFKLTCTK